MLNKLLLRSPISGVVGMLPLALSAVLASSAGAWSPGSYPAGSRGFSVDTGDRDDVVSFWHGVYLASEGYESRVGWTGNYLALPLLAGAEGTTSAAFVLDVERRVNFYRAMCGVPADVRLNSGSAVAITGEDPHKPAADTSKAAAAQRAAYMVIRTYNTSLLPGDVSQALNHSPNPLTCIGWTTAAWNANANGNICFGFFGPGAIDAYLKEDTTGVSGWNTQVGHRRWVLYPPATDFATGDTPGSYAADPLEVRSPTNVLYVVQRPGEAAVGLPKKFTSYPSAGFFPAPVNSRFWSLSYPGADFSKAVVSISGPGGAVAVSKKAPVGGFGENTLVWEVSGAAAAQAVTADATYAVSVTGISGAGVPTSHSYSVTLIDPEAPGGTGLVGTDLPHVSTPSAYWFETGRKVEGVQVNSYQAVPASWTEGAEDANPNLVIATSAGADLRSPVSYAAPFATYKAIAGAKSYWLSLRKKYDLLKNSVVDDWFELDRDILPGAGASLSFKYKRGYMTPATALNVEQSSDGGRSWSVLGSPVLGNADGSADTLVTAVAPLLSASATPIRLRFRLTYRGAAFGGFYTPENSLGFPFSLYPVGIFLDDIKLTNCTWLERKKVNEVSPAERKLVFNGASAGGTITNGSKWYLRKRVKLGNEWQPYEAAKVLTATNTKLTGYEEWEKYEYAILAGGFSGDDDGDGVSNGVEYAFSTDPLARTVLKDAVVVDGALQKLSISRPLAAAKAGVTYGAEWSENLSTWSSVGVTVTTGGGEVRATVPMAGTGRYLRWKLTKP